MLHTEEEILDSGFLLIHNTLYYDLFSCNYLQTYSH